MTRHLSEIELKPEYRSDTDNLVRDFFVPCLKQSTLYRRAVGYFTSRGLAAAAQGLTALIASGGRMQLVASPVLDSDDLEAIQRGYSARDDILTRALLRQIESIPEGAFHDRLGYLAWLIAEERLDVRIAVPIDEQRKPRQGIYHEKLGIFSDGHENTIAFTGSPNETSGGLLDNFETIDVFWSWDDPLKRVVRKVQNFQRLWNDETRGLKVVTFPDAVRDEMLKYRPSNPYSKPSDSTPEVNDPSVNNRWRHQDEAIAKFLAVERGVLEMATGTGKTRTALRICESLLRDRRIDSIIVAADGNDLLDQWFNQLLPLANRDDQMVRIARHYGDFHEREHFILDPSNSILLASRYALPSALRALPTESKERTILIHDEVHRLGSPGNREKLSGLSDGIRYRLGLSATPEREYDQDGTAFVEKHVGSVCFRFGLAEAIQRGILSPFDYYPLEYAPDKVDSERIRQVYKRAAARDRAGQPMSQEEMWTELARVHKISPAKLPVFQTFIQSHPNLLERCIVFVETQDYGEAVLKIVHRLRHDFHTYFSGEDSDILHRFARGDLECLLTCHRLSEGIDIQSLQSVILFSSARARLETIQRMGRCLRVNPKDPLKRATIVDFIRVAGVSGIPEDDNADQRRRDWLEELALVRPEKEAL